jgi:hypothetical protein
MLRGCVRFLVFCFLGLLVLMVFASQGFVVWGSTGDDAAARIGEADDALGRAFVAVSGAEGVGANVSGLLVRLNVASGLYSSAEVAFQSGNYTLAVERAGDCVGLADGVFGDAGVLRGEALDAAAGWWRVVVFSVVGACVFVGVLAGVWVYVRRRYAGSVLGLKPEVTG